MFSVIPIGSLTIGYSSFAAILMVGMLIIPEIPIRKKIMLTKRNSLIKINCQIQKEHDKIFEENKNNIEDINLNKLDLLIKFKEKVDSISPWPSILKILKATMSILFISAIPPFIECLLKNF